MLFLVFFIFDSKDEFIHVRIYNLFPSYQRFYFLELILYIFFHSLHIVFYDYDKLIGQSVTD